MTFSNLDDAILAQYAKDDVEAFTELYIRYVDRVYRYFYSRTVCSIDAEDLTSQTFFALVKGISRYRSSTPFGAYLFAIARRKLIDFWKEPSFISLDIFENDLISKTNTEEIVQLKIDIENILRHLTKLAPARAEVVRLRIFAGLSSLETAQVMNKSEGAIDVLLHRALADLRKLNNQVDM